jgi:hypothetical protein
MSFRIVDGWSEVSKAQYSMNNIRAGRWYHVVGTYDSSGDAKAKLYINGTNIVNGSANSNYGYDDSLNLYIGAEPVFYGSYFNGSIDDVMIFNRSLSSEEIKALYANTSSKYLGVNYTNLSNGNYTFKAYAQDSAGNVNETEEREVVVNSGTSYALSLSSSLSQQIRWDLATLPAVNQSSEGNNGTGVTEYFVNISTEGGLVDVYIRANGDLLNLAEDALGIGNETYSFNSTNSTVPSNNKFSLTTNFVDNKIGDGLSDGSIIYLKFFLSAPPQQSAGTYNNTLEIKAVSHGQSP